MKKELLPIGTVVLLNGGTKKLMITGYRSKTKDDDKVYDYNGCIFPEGFIENTYCLFNHGEIEEVFYLGLENDESKELTSHYISDNTGYEVSSVNGESVNHVTNERKIYRKRSAPTNPMSVSEMRSKYGVNLNSGGNIFDYKTGK